MNKKQKPLIAFLPAAGLGERLRPVTGHIPKPLLPFMGEPLIDMVLERLAQVSPARIGVNIHYKPEMFRKWASGSPHAGHITFFEERQILGTGGALRNAKDFLSEGFCFLVHNADILMDVDLQRLVDAHVRSGNIATLATHHYPALANVVIDKDGRVLDVESPGLSLPSPSDSPENPSGSAKRTAYTGIAVYSPEILDYLPEGVSHVTIAWLAAARAGRKVQTVDFTGCRWNDIGTPATYAAGVLETLSLNGETVYRSPGADCGRIEAQGYLVLETGCKVHEGATLRNCIIMPGAKISGRERHENSIIGPDYCLELPEAVMRTGSPGKPGEGSAPPLENPLFPGAGPLFPSKKNSGVDRFEETYLIGLGGSDRRYFRMRDSSGRMKGPNGSLVLMECLPGDKDFERHIEYTRFFAEIGVPVPGLLAVDGKGKRALFEDLGDLSLYAWLKLPREKAEIADIYKKIIGILSILHTRAHGQLDKCAMLAERRFDYDHLRWETGYFLERFVTGLMGISPPPGLDEEFHLLASLVASFPKAVVHRDFQSQNIMIEADMEGAARSGGGPVKNPFFPRPRIIDYQGARIGPHAYDLASILWDPYSRLDDGLRDEALDYYIGLREKGGEPPDLPSAKDFKRTILPCRLQRHMQALGAYAFLSQMKGKRYFLKHIPEGLRLLKEDIAECSGQKNHGIEIDLPVLSRLVNGLDFKG